MKILKNLASKPAVLLMTAALSLSVPASAERYLVVFKNKDVFAQTHVQLMLQQMPLSQVRLQKGSTVQTPFDGARVQVEDSLQHLNSLVIEANDEESIRRLENSGAIAVIEKEVFHPAPKPVQGFTRTQPWDYDVNYAVSAFTAGRVGQIGPKTPYGISLVNAPQAWETAHYGQGARVVILDTGIDRDHPALKNNIEKMQDFVMDRNQPYDVADKVGHGTHVAGTIAAEFGADGFVGVAPKAKLLIGRVCSTDGCSNISVAAGINWGIQEKADVISMSLGGPFATQAEIRAVEMAEKQGVTIVAASGNDGKPQVSYPAALPTVIAVGAVNENSQKADFSNWGPELDIAAPGVHVTSSVPLGTGRESKVRAGLAGKEQVVVSTSFTGAPDVMIPMAQDLADAGLGRPQDFAAATVQGKFALIQRGEINFAEKVKNAIAAGAAGAVIFNNAPGLIQGALTQDGTTVAIPVVMIEKTVGEQFKQLIGQGQAVRAEIQTVATDFASFDGTSMATPHVAGVVALIKATHKGLTPQQVRDLVKQTAHALQPNDQNQLGAGLIDAAAAVKSVKP